MVGIAARANSPTRTNKSKLERVAEPDRSPKRTRSVLMLEYAAGVGRGEWARDFAFEQRMGVASKLASTPEADETVASTHETGASVAAVGSASTPGHTSLSWPKASLKGPPPKTASVA